MNPLTEEASSVAESLKSLFTKILPELVTSTTTTDEIIKLFDNMGNGLLLERFEKAIPAVTERMTNDEWFPLPSKRTPDGETHNLVFTAVYFLVENAVQQLDGKREGANIPAAIAQSLYALPVAQDIPASRYNTSGREKSFLEGVAASLADLMCPGS